jgi:hypothetical protein
MDLVKLNNKIEASPTYQFLQHHKRVINIIQGIVVILLLISINSYLVKDHFIKKQIKENCGYVDNTFKCICEKHYVDNWEELQKGNLNLNFTSDNNVSMVR